MRMGNYKCDTHKANQIVDEQPYSTLSLPGCRALGERYAANGWEGRLRNEADLMGSLL